MKHLFGLFGQSPYADCLRTSVLESQYVTLTETDCVPHLVFFLYALAMKCSKKLGEISYVGATGLENHQGFALWVSLLGLPSHGDTAVPDFK